MSAVVRRGEEDLADAELTGWVVENLEAIAVVAQARPEAPVPSCPGWTVADLLDHLATIMMGWYRHNLVTSPERGDFMQAAMSAPPMPEDLPGRIAYLRDSGVKFAELVATLDLDAPVWTFGPAGPARFWLLRAATESAIHRWDAEMAVGTPSAVSPARAVMSIDETVRGMWPRLLVVDFPPGAPLRRTELPARSLLLWATDYGDGWLARPDGGELTVEAVGVRGADRVGADPDAVLVEGTAKDLMLYLWGRTTAREVGVRGDREVADAWNLCLRAGL